MIRNGKAGERVARINTGERTFTLNGERLHHWPSGDALCTIVKKLGGKKFGEYIVVPDAPGFGEAWIAASELRRLKNGER